MRNRPAPLTRCRIEIHPGNGKRILKRSRCFGRGFAIIMLFELHARRRRCRAKTQDCALSHRWRGREGLATTAAVYQFSLRQRTDAHGDYLRTAAVLHGRAGAMAAPPETRWGVSVRLCTVTLHPVDAPVPRLAKHRPMNGRCRFTKSRRTAPASRAALKLRHWRTMHSVDRGGTRRYDRKASGVVA